MVSSYEYPLRMKSHTDDILPQLEDNCHPARAGDDIMQSNISNINRNQL